MSVRKGYRLLKEFNARNQRPEGVRCVTSSLIETSVSVDERSRSAGEVIGVAKRDIGIWVLMGVTIQQVYYLQCIRSCIYI